LSPVGQAGGDGLCSEVYLLKGKKVNRRDDEELFKESMDVVCLAVAGAADGMF
jgi:hypothetical protein